MDRARGFVCLLTGLCLILVLSSTGFAQDQNRRSDFEAALTNPDVFVDPDTLEVTITCDEPWPDSVCITTPPGGIISAADILFIMDVTGSMGDILEEVKGAALDIMSSIMALGIDATFGVGSLSDYPAFYESCGYLNHYYGWPDSNDYAWRMDQDITTNTALITDAINALKLQNGQDTPEDWARALYETQFFSFRPNTKRIVLAFGDSPTHDCDFYNPTTYGWDPGRDEVIGTADDLDFESVVQQLVDAGIIVLVLDGSEGELEPWKTHAQQSFQYMADETGGARFLLSQANQIPDAILQLIGEIAVIDMLTMRVEPEATYGDWATITPDGFPDVGPDQYRCFDVVIAVPTWQPPGNYEFDLILEGGGEIVGSVHVIVHRTGASPTEKTTWSQIRAKFRSETP